MSEDGLKLKYTFEKKERLCSQKEISNLFEKGTSFIAYPLRVVYLPISQTEDNFPKILISVSKHKFKRANKRNRVKRLVREAYRLNKYPLRAMCEKDLVSLNIAFLYLKNELPSFEEIEKSVKKSIGIINENMKGKEE